MKLRALLVDDERLARVELRRLLAAHPEIEVVAEADSVATARTALASAQPDVVFLDVQMPGGSGFELLGGDGLELAVVFVTAFDAHALRAFEVNALDYLLKPVHPERLAQAVGRLLRRVGEGGAAAVAAGTELPERAPAAGEPVEAVGAGGTSGEGRTDDGVAARAGLDAVGMAGSAVGRSEIPRRPLAVDDFLFVADGRRARFVKVARLVALLAADDYTALVTDDGQRQLVAGALRDWETRLPPSFVRIHRGAVINLEHVERVDVLAGAMEVRLRGLREAVPVSRRQAAALRDRLG
jgi:two-component system LytT family response regulator